MGQQHENDANKQYETTENIKQENELHRQGIMGKDIERINKDNWFLRIEKNSLLRFLERKNLLFEYQEWSVADARREDGSREAEEGGRAIKRQS